MSIAVADFLRLTLMEIRSARAGDVPAPDDAGDALLIFNELLDALNADGRALFTTTATTFTLTPSLQPHTIGLAANVPTFSVTIGRPATISAANIVLANNIRVPLSLLDDADWFAIRAGAASGRTPTITASIPQRLYYSSDWPNGSIFLWPVPTTAYGLELQFSTLLASLLMTDTFDLPAGYQQALRLTLAELLASAFGQTVAESTMRNARDARERVWANNDTVPRLCTRDGGMPGGRRGLGYDYRTGMTS